MTINGQTVHAVKPTLMQNPWRMNNTALYHLLQGLKWTWTADHPETAPDYNLYCPKSCSKMVILQRKCWYMVSSGLSWLHPKIDFIHPQLSIHGTQTGGGVGWGCSVLISTPGCSKLRALPCRDFPHFDGFISRWWDNEISTWHESYTRNIVVMAWKWKSKLIIVSKSQMFSTLHRNIEEIVSPADFFFVEERVCLSNMKTCVMCKLLLQCYR